MTKALSKLNKRVRSTGLPEGGNNPANKALPEVYRLLGIRQEAIDTIRRCIADRDEKGRPTFIALRASEHVLERTDPQPKTHGDDIRSSGGKVNVHVTWERPPLPQN